MSTSKKETQFWGRALALIVAALVATTGPVAAQPEAQRATEDAERVRVTVTVRGGVSKGSYQAGLTYGLLYLMRRADEPAFRDATGLPPYELAAMTGASAGNINSILGSISWCSRSLATQRADKSLFWNIWTPVGLEQLFPEVRPSQSEEAEFVFTRAYFDTALYDTLVEAMRQPPVGKDCRVPFGITMTRTDAAGEVELTDKLPVSTVRYVSLAAVQAWMDPEVDGGYRLAFRPLRFDLDDEEFNVQQFGTLALPMLDPDKEDLRQDAQVMLNFSKGSSAFPVAFAPVDLRYRPYPNSEPTSGLFLDGGAFDNKPLELARQLSDHVVRSTSPSGRPPLELQRLEPKNAFVQAPSASPSLPDSVLLERPSAGDGEETGTRKTIFIESENQRHDGTEGRAERRREQHAPAMSLAVYGPFLKNAIGAARQYELEVMARRLDQKSKGEIDMTDRYHPIVGRSLQSFGAFFGRMYREYDFYVGLYDATAYAARTVYPDPEQYPDRRALQKTLIGALQVPDGSEGPGAADARELMSWLYDEEHSRTPACRTQKRGAPDNYLLAVACAARDWESKRATRGKRDMTVFATALQDYWPLADLEQRSKTCHSERTALPADQQMAVDCLVDPITVDLVRNPPQTIGHLVEAGLAQLRFNEALSRAEQERMQGQSLGASTAEPFVELAYFAQRTARMPNTTGWMWSNASMPSRRLRGQPQEEWRRAVWRALAPREVFLSIRDGGWGIGYNPRVRPAWLYRPSGVGIVGAATYVNYGDAADRIILGGGVEWSPGQVVGGWRDIFFSNVQARVTAVPHVDWWRDGPGDRVFGSVGLEISGYFLHGKLRVALHEPALFHGSTWEPEDRWAITIGFADLNGLAYWMYHLLR